MKKRERRYQIRWVTEDEVWGLFCARWVVRHDVFRMHLHFLDGVPDGVEIASVFHDPMRRCFGFVLHHDSFEAVEDGAMIPDGQPITWESLAIEIDRKEHAGHWDCTLPLYEALRRENEEMRKVLADQYAEQPALEAARRLGVAEGLRLAQEREEKPWP